MCTSLLRTDFDKYFETLELAIGEIEKRFNQEDNGLTNSLESFLIVTVSEKTWHMGFFSES